MQARALAGNRQRWTEGVLRGVNDAGLGGQKAYVKAEIVKRDHAHELTLKPHKQCVRVVCGSVCLHTTCSDVLVNVQQLAGDGRTLLCHICSLLWGKCFRCQVRSQEALSGLAPAQASANTPFEVDVRMQHLNFFLKVYSYAGPIDFQTYPFSSVSPFFLHCVVFHSLPLFPKWDENSKILMKQS